MEKNIRGGHSDLMSALRGGFQNLMHAYQGGGGGAKKPQKYAYIICERPHTISFEIIFFIARTKKNDLQKFYSII